MAKRVAIIHPDLGIGGAEQLIVNVALGLQMNGYEVRIFTPRHDRTRCFKETCDGTINVEVRGNWFPAKILNKATALCSLIRMFLVSLYIIFFGGQYDYIIIDQVSAILPLFYLSSSKIIFYCHYPDQLLCTNRGGFLKQLYRLVLDKIEEIGIHKADLIYVNSNYTKSVTKSTFKSLSNRELSVLYPCISLNFPSSSPHPKFLQPHSYFFSLNRYERKKNINLAIEAYAKLGKNSVKLLVGGGFDPDLNENIEHLKELIELCKKLGLKYVEVKAWDKVEDDVQVYFVKNLTEAQREEALFNAIAVLYTPENEHFGIVPVEAMARGTPVVANRSGGPIESVKDGKSGFLLDKDPENWSRVMLKLINDPKSRSEMKKFAKDYACNEFSLKYMGELLDKGLKGLA